MINVLLGCALIVASTLIHTLGMTFAIKLLRHLHEHRRTRASAVTRPIPIATLVLVMFLATLVETSMWGATYLWLGALHTVEEAGYFSMVTFTSLGYGDIVLHGRWRLLASFEAANGVIMFGWTTALIFAGVQHVYFKSPVPDEQRGA